jgi:hypothetical protein
MRNVLLPVLAMFTLVFACATRPESKTRVRPGAEYFEGRITYRYDMETKSDTISQAALEELFGSTAELYFKEGNYLEIYEGGYMKEQLYNRKTNKVYFTDKYKGDTVFRVDAGKPGDEILRQELHPEKEKILNIECDELVLYYANKTISIYYNSDSLQINPDWYSNYTSYNKNIISRKMGALYLKYRMEYPGYIATLTATSILWQKIDDKFFKVPGEKILVKDK